MKKHKSSIKLSINQSEKIALLNDWKNLYLAMNEQWDNLSNSIGANVDSPLGDSIWLMFSSYTKLLSDVVEDCGEWLSWYCYENKMGTRKFEAGFEKDMRPIESIEDLLWIIEASK